MRVLYVINHLQAGGAEALVYQHVAYLERAGHQVHVCTIYSAGHYADKLHANGTRVWNLARASERDDYPTSVKYDPRIVVPLANLIRRGNYELVHSHLFPAALFVAMVSCFVRKPHYICSEHSVFNDRRRYAGLRILDWLMYARYRRIIAVSSEVQRALVTWLPSLKDKTCVVPNALDPHDFDVPDSAVRVVRTELGVGEQDSVILYAGRLHPHKGVDVLIQAMSAVSGRCRTARLLVAGDGPLGKQLRRQVQQSLLSNVSLLGMRTDIPVLLNIADLVVLPSRCEGLPMILLEAMACRKPVVAARVGGVPEVITHGVNGWLVPPGNPRALGEGIQALLLDSALRKRLGDAGYQTVKDRYATDVVNPRLLEIYTALARKRHESEDPV